MVKGRQGERVRLYVRGTILGYKRSKSNQYPNTSLIQIEGVNTKEEVAWLPGLTETVVLSVPNLSLICPQNPWVTESEFSCTQATYKEFVKRPWNRTGVIEFSQILLLFCRFYMFRP
ncbi:hypothetical protein H6P81_006194 [Aristolochia fimbriata]|uniref:Uncharacterized protein n=1 Tax=Aristolochia fimbriata TaxID=158543 RepID=A0AAV7EWM8_ARIFI|nr:hypothetical protein H6P81_006194 [Aristolochia fimbriata]